MLDPDVLPARLRDADRWAGWVYGPPQPNGRRKKTPTDPATGLPISIANPAHLRPLDALLGAARVGPFDGLGFALDPDGELTDVDLDDVADPDIVDLSAMAAGIMDDLGGTYFELSPSRRGLHGPALCRLNPTAAAWRRWPGWAGVRCRPAWRCTPAAKCSSSSLPGTCWAAGLLADHHRPCRTQTAGVTSSRPVMGTSTPLVGVGQKIHRPDLTRRLTAQIYSHTDAPM